MIEHFQYIGDTSISGHETFVLTSSWHAHWVLLQRHCCVHVNCITLDVVYASALRVHIGLDLIQVH